MTENNNLLETLKLPARVIALLPIRIVLRVEGSKIQGMIENSFNLDYSDTRVRVFWSSKNATSNLGGNFEVDGVADAKHNAMHMDGTVFDPTKSWCPVEIDWDAWLAATEKFNSRNAPFKVRDLDNQEVNNYVKDRSEISTGS